MDAWTKVVEDLQKFSNPPQPHIEKTFLQRMWNIIYPNDCGCSGNCSQGKTSCECR